MALGPDVHAYARDLFAGLGRVTTKAMFGGLGIYHDGVIFALMRSDGTLLLKGAGDFATDLEEMGCTRWVYARESGKGGAMPYWTLPDSALDDPEEAAALARRALAALG